MIHIYFNSWEYGEDYIRGYSEEGEPMYDSYTRKVDVTCCGDQGYEGEIEFALDPEDADCHTCIDEYVLETLGGLP